MEKHDVERFSLGSRWLHWTVTFAALILAVTGIFLYVPQWGIVAQGGWTRLIHRIAAVIFVAAPGLFLVSRPGASWSFVKEMLTWGKDDFEWLKAAPDYYFGGEEGQMPPQKAMNTGQKLWAVVAVGSAIGFLVTGILMWFFSGKLSPGVIMWSVFAHDFFFILAGAFLLIHVYLGAIHPRMTESLRSMITGKVSTKYAKSHHGKWYAEVSKEKAAAKESKE